MSEIEHYIGLIMAAGYDESDLEDLVGALRARSSIEYAVLMADGPEAKTTKPEPTREQLPIIGRERFLIDALAKVLRSASGSVGHAISDWTPETKRGSYFEVMLHVAGEPTGHVARVTVELDRLDPELIEAYKIAQARI